MRTWLALAGALVLPVAAALMVATDSGWVGAVLSAALWATIAVGFAIRIARAARTGGGATRALTPASDAGEDVQAVFLGRKPTPPVTYGRDDPAVSALVDPDAHDPLDDPVWTVTPPPATSSAPEQDPEPDRS